MRNITPQMTTHLQQEVVTLAVCVRIVPTQGSLQPPLYLTEHDVEINYGGNVYSPRESFTLSTIKTSSDFTSDNTEVTLGNRDFVDVETFSDAEVYIFYVNWKDLNMGEISLFTGYVSATSLREDKKLALTISGIGKKLSNKYLPKYSRTCRATFCDAKCGLKGFPAFTSDVFFSFPRPYNIGEQPLQRPGILTALGNYAFANWSGTGWALNDPTLSYPSSAENGEVSNTFALDAGIADGDLLMFEYSISTAVTVYIEQLDNTATVIQSVWYTYTASSTVDKHNLVTYKLPLATSIRLRIVAPANVASDIVVAGITYTPSASIPVARKKLARITSEAAADKVIIPNGEFHIDGTVPSTTNLDDISVWDGTCSGSFSVTSNIFTATNTEIHQTIQLPPMGCTLLSNGCYFLSVAVEYTGTFNEIKVEIYDDQAALIQTEVLTSTTKLFRLTGEPDTAKITIDCDDGTVEYVRMWLYNALVSSQTDPLTVNIASEAAMGDAGDIWLDEIDSLYFNTSVESVPSPTESRIMILAPGLTDIHYGQIVFTTGANAGIKRDVRQYTAATRQLEIYKPLPYQPAPTDKLVILRGCDKTIDVCGGTFNNGVNFRGEPYIVSAAQIGELLNG